MNYKKIILVGFISAFVAILTSVLGVAGTVIGSVISSVLYNMLSEALEKPVTNASFNSKNFEWDIAYIFPIVVIAIIQLMLIFALLAESGVLPANFLNAYLSLQHLANNNLYRILGLALIVMSIYPIVLKPENVKKIHGIILAGVGLVFLARGFVDLGNAVTDIYDGAFIHFDLEIAIVAFVLIVVVIIRVLMSALESRRESEVVENNNGEKTFTHKVYHLKHEDIVHDKRHIDHVKNEKSTSPRPIRSVNFNKSTNIDFEKESNENIIQDKSGNSKAREVSKNDVTNPPKSGINKSSDNIRFESNDLLEEYKK